MDLMLNFLFLVVYIDAKILRRQDGPLYQRTLRYKEWVWSLAVLSFIFFAGASLALEKRNIVTPDHTLFGSIIYLIVVLAYYLALRVRFKIGHEKINPSQSIDSETLKKYLISDGLGVLLFTFLGSACLELFVSLTNKFFPVFANELEQTLAITAFYLFLMIFLIYRVTQKYPPEYRFFNFVALNRNDQPLKKIVIVPSLLGMLVAFVFSNILLQRPVQPPTPFNDIINSAESVYSLIILFCMAVLVAPLLEEIIFRGYFYRILKEAKGQAVAIPVIAFIFGLLHINQYQGDWLAIVMVFGVGIFLTLLRAFLGTTIASSIMHYTFNGGMIIFPVVILFAANPAYIEYHMNYPNLDNPAKERLLLQSIEKYPNSFIQAYNDLAWMYAKEGKNLDQALEFIEKALSFDPQNPVFLDTKAEVLYKLGRFDEAIAIEEKLLEEDPASAFYQEQVEKFKKAKENNQDTRNNDQIITNDQIFK